MNNKDLHAARKGKNNEFYTQMADITKEMNNYTDHFKGKIVYCNCDDPKESKFFDYFTKRFHGLGLNKVITTCYKNSNWKHFSKHNSDQAVWLEYKGDLIEGKRKPDLDKTSVKPLIEDGDFRSDECVALLKEADIVVTNPPFTLFRDYIELLMNNNKKFIVLGNMNAITVKSIFPYFKQNKIWYGPSINSGDREFGVPDDYPLTAAGCRTDENGKKFVKVKGVRWFTNLDFKQRYEDIPLTQTYSPSKHPNYDECDAINVDAVDDIPRDYKGVMGVPISFMDKWNPDQFEILGLDDHTLEFPKWRGRGPNLNGEPRYRRIMIRNKRI